jgi:hypothetical protein
MDPAEGHPLIRAGKERAFPQAGSMGILPVTDTYDSGECFLGNSIPADPFSIREMDGHMLQDIKSRSCQPGDKIFDHSLLPPSPLFATFPALGAVLFSGQKLLSPRYGMNRNHVFYWFLFGKIFFCRTNIHGNLWLKPGGSGLINPFPTHPAELCR